LLKPYKDVSEVLKEQKFSLRPKLDLLYLSNLLIGLPPLRYNRPMLPQSIGRYQILEKLGSGGMAVVYLAQDAVFERPVAIKVLAQNLGADPENRERFRREARAIALIEHTAVVPVYEYGEDGELLYLVMRYMQGGSLKDRLSHGPLPLELAASITGRVATALDKAHTLGMIHRDIKPGNILFDLEDNPYITDFGLVKLVEASVQLTHSEFFGTPAYTSPEQCQGEKDLDARADTYSLAAVFFHMVTGAPPYQSKNAMALLMKHISDPIPRLSDAAPDLPSALQTVIDRGMAKSPSDRYPTTGDMAKDIDRIVSPRRGSGVPAARSPWSPEISSAAISSPATESAPSASFDSLREKKPAPSSIVEDQPTRRDTLAPGMKSGTKPAQAPDLSMDSLATNAMDLKAIPTERRRLEWKPQADTSPPPAPDAASSSIATAPSKETSPAYTEPPKPLEKKTPGIPILLLIIMLLVISVLYFALQKHLF
jgi:serine/threonine protein kinase